MVLPHPLRAPGEAPSLAFLGLQESHWSFLVDSCASLMYGSDWQDQADGTFTAVAERKFYGPLDLYLAGFLAPHEVPPWLLID